MSAPAGSSVPNYKIGVVLGLAALVMLWRLTVLTAIVAPIAYLVWMVCRPQPRK
jgi:hypothetical protein